MRRQRRGLLVLLSHRRTPRSRSFASVTTAELEQAEAEQVEQTEAPPSTAAPAEAGERTEGERRSFPRRRSFNGSPRRPKKDVIYQLSDLSPGQEVDGVVVSGSIYIFLTIKLSCVQGASRRTVIPDVFCFASSGEYHNLWSLC